MNFILISPQYPKTFWKFAEALKSHGINVLGIGDAPYDTLSPELKSNLTEYYYCPAMNDFNELFKAVAFFSFRYGKIDWIESNNEYWLDKDARIRELFHITTGVNPSELKSFQDKILMKPHFQEAGVPTARFIEVKTLEESQQFATSVGYPVFVKPRVGVGAVASYKLSNEDEMKRFFATQPKIPYVMEEYIDGTIVSYDGMADANSEVVFQSTHVFPVPNDEIVNQVKEDFYFTLPYVPPDLEEVGRKTVKAFGVKNRFFHIEFFRLNKTHPYLGSKNSIVSLEVNMRPAGGYTLEMMQASQGLSPYRVFADVLIKGKNLQERTQEPRYCIEVARRDSLIYAHTVEEIKALYQSSLWMNDRYPYPINVGMGDTFFMATFKTYEEGEQFREYVLAKK